MPFRDAPFAPLQGVGMRPEGLLEGEGDVTEGYGVLGVGLAAPGRPMRPMSQTWRRAQSRQHLV